MFRIIVRKKYSKSTDGFKCINLIMELKTTTLFRNNSSSINHSAGFTSKRAKLKKSNNYSYVDLESGITEVNQIPECAIRSPHTLD